MSSKKTKPKISILLTAYNGEKFISEQVESILNQSYHNWELIICEDRSKDSTLQIARKYVKKDDRIIVKQNKKNLGLAKNVENGLKYCKGDYVAICDVDDFWLPDKLEKQANYLVKHKNIGLVYHDLYVVDENLSIINQSFQKKMKGNFLSLHNIGVHDDSLASLVKENHVAAPTIIFRKELIKYIVPMPEKVFQDYWIALIAATFSKIGYIHKPLLKYRQHHTNMVGANVQGYNFYISNMFKKEFKTIFKKENEAHLAALNNLLRRTSNLPQQEKIIREKINVVESFSRIMNAKGFVDLSSNIINSVFVIYKSKQLYNYKLLIYLIAYRMNFINHIF